MGRTVRRPSLESGLELMRISSRIEGVGSGRDIEER